MTERLPIPTPDDVEKALIGQRDYNNAYAKWTLLDEVEAISRQRLWFAETINPNSPQGYQQPWNMGRMW